MDFILNEYHRNISDEEFIQDIINVANMLQKDSITGKEYDEYGKFHSSTIRRRFGNWKQVLEKANLSVKGHNFRCEYSVEDIKDDVRRVLKILGQDTLTKQQYDQHGQFKGTTLQKKYKGWNNVLKLVGLEPTLNRDFSNEDLFEEIERIWILLGRQPTTTDIKKGISKYSLQSYSRRFGGWRNSLQAFIEYVNDENSQKNMVQEVIENREVLSLPSVSVAHKTNRDINLRLRFKVMLRDNFKCCMCGASPATNSDIILHIDHIKPWAKGGETILENLQTLCSKCNLGKSDLEV